MRTANLGFNKVQFNIDALPMSGRSTDTVTITIQDNTTHNTVGTHTLNLGGENFFTGIADPSYTIMSVTLSTELPSIAGIADLQQVRLNPIPIDSPVPEPATILLFGTGLAGLARVSRRRKK